MKTTDFAKVLTSFLTVELPSVRNVSPNTVLSYRDTFKYPESTACCYTCPVPVYPDTGAGSDFSVPAGIIDSI